MNRFPSAPAGVATAFLVLAQAAGGCGSGGAAEKPSDEIAAGALCTPYNPSAAAWSSLPTSRPPVMTTPVGSPAGKYIYAVGTWVAGGTIKRQIVRSGDLGDSWCVLSTANSITDVIPAPAHAGVLYAITWTGTEAGETAVPTLLRSIDAGTTWSTQGTPPDSAWFDASGVIVASSDPRVVWFTRTTNNKLLLSRDGAKTWTARDLPPALTAISDSIISWADNIVIDTASPNRLLASGMSGRIDSIDYGSWPRQTFTSEDWGATWNAVDLPTTLSTATASNGILADAGSAIYLRAESKGLWRSTDWGRSWRQGEDLSSRASLTALTTLGSHRPGELFIWNLRTLDGGVSWKEIALPAAPTFEPVLAAADGNVILGPTGAGFTATSDAGATWYSSPIGADSRSYVYAMSQSPVEPRPLWTFLQTEGAYPTLRSIDGGLTWTQISSIGGVLLWDGGGADVAFSLPGEDIQRTENGGVTWEALTLPSASDRALAAAVCAPPISCLYGLFMDGKTGAITTARSDDHGGTWTEVHAGPVSLGFVGFPGPLAVAADDPQRLYLRCGNRLCESPDGGATWTYSSLPGPVTADLNMAFLANGVVLAAAGGISRSEDGGQTWTSVLGTMGRLVISQAHPGTVFLIPDRTMAAPSPLLRSDDAGSSWRSAVPDGAPPWTVVEVVDTPDGRFLALVQDYGLVTFD